MSLCSWLLRAGSLQWASWAGWQTGVWGLREEVAEGWGPLWITSPTRLLQGQASPCDLASLSVPRPSWESQAPLKISPQKLCHGLLVGGDRSSARLEGRQTDPRSTCEDVQGL